MVSGNNDCGCGCASGNAIIYNIYNYTVGVILLLACCMARFFRTSLFPDHPSDTMEQCDAILRKDPAVVIGINIIIYTRVHEFFR